MLAAIQQTAKQFRLGFDGHAYQSLIALTNDFENIIKQDGGVSPDVMQVLQEILQAQVRGDYLWLADCLDYRLLPLLKD